MYRPVPKCVAENLAQCSESACGGVYRREVQLEQQAAGAPTAKAITML